MSQCVGVLALQGGFAEHLSCFETESIMARPVRHLDDARLCQAFVIPGGESTTLMHLLLESGLSDYFKQQHQDGTAFWGTCAGAIVCARRAAQPETVTLDLIDVTVYRNAYGRQLNSRLIALTSAYDAEQNLGTGVMIRAPSFKRWGEGVQPMVCSAEGEVMALAGDRCLLTSFHPELSDGAPLNWHRWFAHVAFEPSSDFTEITMKDHRV